MVNIQIHRNTVVRDLQNIDQLMLLEPVIHLVLDAETLKYLDLVQFITSFPKRSYSSGNAGLPVTRNRLLSNDHRDSWRIMWAVFANGIKLLRTISNRKFVQPFTAANIPRSELLWKIFSFAFFVKFHTHRPFICFRIDRIILIFETKDKLGFILIRKISSSVTGGIHAEKSRNALDACSVETPSDANALERSLKAASFIHCHLPSTYFRSLKFLFSFNALLIARSIPLRVFR